MNDPFNLQNSFNGDSQSLSSVSLIKNMGNSENNGLHNKMADEIDKLQREKRELEEKLKKIEDEKKQHKTVSYLEIKPKEGDIKDFYDCRILADSFFTLLQDRVWEIEFKNWQEYQEKVNNPTIKIAVLGYENVGKSWMVGNLMGSEVPQGKHTKTTGVCILYPKDNRIPWVALDTPGTNVSVKVESLKKDLEQYFAKKDLIPEDILRMLYGDNILIETLLQEFLINHAEVLLVVVGKLRRDDQRLIRRMKNQKTNNKKILIIHNLLETQLISDVEDIIEEDLRQTFNGIKKNIGAQESGENKNRYVYYADEKNEVEHVIFAHQGSEAGDYYNQSSLEYLRNVITTVSNQTKFDLVKAFEEHVNVHLQHYLSVNIKQEKQEGSEKEKAFFLEQEDEEEIPRTFRLRNPDRYDLKSNSSNEFGEIKTYGNEGIENVPFSVKIVTKGGEKYLHVELEIVGNFDPKKCTFKIFGNVSKEFSIRIQGTCLNEEEEKNEGNESSKLIQGTRRFGNFVVSTQTIQALEGYSIKRSEKPQCDDKTTPGLKVFIWKLYKIVASFE